MNIAGSADTALWQEAASRARTRLPKLDPRVIAHEQVEGGVRTVIAMLYAAEGYYRLTPSDWELIQLFDGERSYAEIAELYTQKTGVAFSEEQVAEYADSMRDTDLFYKAPAEKSLALMQSLVKDRKRRRRKKIDLSDIVILTWNSNPYFDWLYPKLKFIYTRWFTYLTLACFASMAWILWDRSGELWNDSLSYYNFTRKGFADLIEFWFAFGFVVFFHESAHGLTCKHWGARVHRMGFTLFYFAPTFFCDVSEAYVYGGKWQRISIMFAGAWVELMMCTVAAVVWWATAPGMLAHDLAYKALLVAGIAIIVLNLNPLIKLDGYYILCELLGIPDIKERASGYASNWIRSVLGLPVQLDYLRTRRKWLYIVYALLSGIYGYVLLFVAVSLTYNISRTYWPEWAFVPALTVALLMFKTPLKRFGAFMKTVYLQHLERLRQWFTPARTAVAAVVVLVFLLLPIWRDTIEGRFALEAPARAVVRAEVPGRVAQINVAEGQNVAAGAVLATLTNLQLESSAQHSDAELTAATARATRAQLQYTGFAEARQEQERAATERSNADAQMARLRITAPISGVVVTPRPADLVGSYVVAGGNIVEIAQLSPLRARIYVPEFAMRDLHVGAATAFHIDDAVVTFKSNVSSVAPATAEIPPGLMRERTYKGEEVPNYFAADAYINNPGNLREGMVGTAKILIGRKSVLALAWEVTRNFLGRRVW